MYGHEVPVDFIQLPPRALPQDWIAVTVADVAEMLRQARVREPWHAPELGCLSLAQCINNPLGYRSVDSPGKAIPKKRRGHDCGVNDGKPARTKTRRARDAIDELRRALPSAITEFKSSVARSFTVYVWPPLGAEHLREIQDLPQATARCEILKNVLALLNSLPPRPRQRTKAWWRLDAAKLWEIYRRAIDVSAGISPGGPAVRFIEAALARMGYRCLPKHIESALHDPVDWRDEFLRRRLDDLMI
jgi:hypothetical protein